MESSCKNRAKTGRTATGTFPKGQSGNPHGRPRGSRNKATLAAMSLLEGQAEALTAKAIEKALQGDLTALKMCLDRICPAPKYREPFSLPTDRAGQLKELASLVANGELSAQAAREISEELDNLRRKTEWAELLGG